MQNIGEEICGEYLKYIFNCEFISYNVNNPDSQGEIDVIGINLIKKFIYICEVATHTTGFQYVKNKRPDNYNRLLSKFKKDIDYAKKYFYDYQIVPMFWSPVVKINTPKANYNTMDELKKVRNEIKELFYLEIIFIINQKYSDCLNELREYASSKGPEFKSSVMRIFQIENSLEINLKILNKRENIKK